MQVKTDAPAVGGTRAWLDRRVAGWALYDVASSSDMAIVPLLFVGAGGRVLLTVDPTPQIVDGGIARARP